MRNNVDAVQYTSLKAVDSFKPRFRGFAGVPDLSYRRSTRLRHENKAAFCGSFNSNAFFLSVIESQEGTQAGKGEKHVKIGD
jgi:hypothetical protein